MDALQLLSAKLTPLSPTAILLIQSSAEILVVLLSILEKLEKQLKDITADNAAVQWLCGHRGIAELTAATMMAEIVDIRRFPSNNHLASYAGLARHEHKTGRSATEINTTVHNHRLKNAFFAAAKNITLHNPDSHLTAYYHSLLDRGLSMTETYKRVGRALVRQIYRGLKSIAQPSLETTKSPPPQAKEDVTATGALDREANKAPSDMTPSDTQYTPQLSRGEPPTGRVAAFSPRPGLTRRPRAERRHEDSA